MSNIKRRLLVLLLLNIFATTSNFKSVYAQSFSVSQANTSLQNKVQSLDNIDIKYQVTEKWNGGYKIEATITATDRANDWRGALYLPPQHKLRQNYGVLVSQESTTQNIFNFAGEEWNDNLAAGQSVKAILIVDGNSSEANINFGNYKNDIGKPQLSSFSSNEARLEQTEDDAVTLDEDENSIKTSHDNNFSEYTSNDRANIRNGINYGEALQKSWLFLNANRSGKMGSDNRIEWRNDATLEDGSKVGRDLSGGYFDAGDHIKFIQPMAFTSTMLAWSGIDYFEAYNRSSQADELLAAVRQATDWFLKAHEMKNGKTSKLWVQVGDKEDHFYWRPAEQVNPQERRAFAIDSQNPGSDAAAGTAAALASAAMLFDNIDNAYANKLLTNAIALYEFAEAYPGKYSDSVSQVNPYYTSWSGYEDEMVEGAIWLYRATKDKKYLIKAETLFKENIGHLGSWSYAADDRSYGALALLAKESSDEFFQEEFKNWMATWLNGEAGVRYTSEGFAIRSPDWGTAPLTMSTSFLAQWFNDFVEPSQKYSKFAKEQIDYVLGDNSRNYSYVIGVGENYPTSPHHRSSAGTQPMSGSSKPNDNLLVGALVAGPIANDNDHQDRRDDWNTNEPATSYNAPFTAAAIAQYHNHGGEPLTDAELAKIKGINDRKTPNIIINPRQ